MPSDELDDRFHAARVAGIELVVSFEHRRGEDCRVTACALPSPAALRAAFRAFRERWPWVTTFGAWNEGNHPSQPTAARPAAAAELYRVLADECPGCRIAAAEVVDSSDMTGWLRAFRAALPHPPRLWALHNYSDVTRAQTTNTDALLALLDGEVWITETGGIVRAGPGRWPYDEARARASVERAFALADARADRISRLYLYQWRAAPHRGMGFRPAAPRRHAATGLRGAGRAAAAGPAGSLEPASPAGGRPGTGAAQSCAGRGSTAAV